MWTGEMWMGGGCERGYVMNFLSDRACRTVMVSECGCFCV
jgi:hypothetical protein